MEIAANTDVIVKSLELKNGPTITVFPEKRSVVFRPQAGGGIVLCPQTERQAVEPEMWDGEFYTAKRLARRFCVSYGTARRWILQLNGDDISMIQKNKGRGKRPWRLRRLHKSKLTEIEERFINH